MKGQAGRRLGRSFFARPTLEVARELLGHGLVRALPDGTRMASPITEVEAYDGFEDLASHAHRGPTPRNRVMFGPPGILYLYRCYGIHWMLNIVTGAKHYPAAVLLRGTLAVSGPGRLTRHFQLTGHQNGLPLDPRSGIWICRPHRPVAAEDVQCLPRVGVDYAGAPWRDMPWRFLWTPRRPYDDRGTG